MNPKQSGPPLKLPWKNSWFQLAVITLVFSFGLLVSDFFHGGHGLALPHIDIPLLAKPGSLDVTSDPTGAHVHIDGQTDLTTPANFAKISEGTYKVTVSAAGYDPDIKTIVIKPGETSSLDSILYRSLGSINLTTVPPRVEYHLVGTAPDNQKEYDGTTPANLTNLPADTYKLTLSGGGMDSHPVTIQVVSRQTVTESIDLVKLNLASDASPTVAKALLGQNAPSSLSAPDKTDYTGLMNRALQEYIRTHAFSLGDAAIASLKSAGVNTDAQEKDLTDARTDYINDLSDTIKDQISQGKFGTARSRLTAITDAGPPDIASAVSAKFQDQMSAYEKQADDAIQAAQTGDPTAGYNSLKPFGDQHPDDINVQLALGHLLTQMPPDHQHLSDQLDVLKSFNRAIIGTAQIADLDALRSKIQNELDTYDRLSAQLDAAKGNSGAGGAGRIADLEREIASDKAKIAGASDVNNAVDSITTGLFHTHVHVVDVSEKQREISADEGKIQEIQTAQQSSQGAVAAAQKEFDAFCATVPW